MIKNFLPNRKSMNQWFWLDYLMWLVFIFLYDVHMPARYVILWKMYGLAIKVEWFKSYAAHTTVFGQLFANHKTEMGFLCLLSCRVYDSLNYSPEVFLTWTAKKTALINELLDKTWNKNVHEIHSNKGISQKAGDILDWYQEGSVFWQILAESIVALILELRRVKC